MYVTNVKNVKEYQLEEKGMHEVKVKYLLHAGVGARRIQLRLFTVGIGGYSPQEKHEHEHEVFVLRGRGVVTAADKEVEVGPEDVIFIPSNEVHQFRNVGDEPLQFLCTKETSKLPRNMKPNS